MSIVPVLLLRVRGHGRTAARALLLSAVVFPAAAPASFGWGCDGHKTVASIAYQRLNPQAKAEAIVLLAQLAPNPTPDTLLHWRREQVRGSFDVGRRYSRSTAGNRTVALRGFAAGSEKVR